MLSVKYCISVNIHIYIIICSLVVNVHLELYLCVTLLMQVLDINSLVTYNDGILVHNLPQWLEDMQISLLCRDMWQGVRCKETKKFCVTVIHPKNHNLCNDNTLVELGQLMLC